MAEAAGLSNTDIAEIYDNMMSGDKSALFKLQQIASNNCPKYMQSYHHKKTPSRPPTHNQQTNNLLPLSESKVEQPPFKEVSSVPAMQTGKDQIFLNAIKRGAKLDAAATRSEKHRAQAKNFRRIVNSSNEVYPNQTKNKSLFKDIKLPNQVQLNMISLEKPTTSSKVYALPRVHKVKETAQVNKATPQLSKAQSTHIEPEKKISGLESIEKSKIVLKKERVDFKEIIGKNKKLREEFEKKNQEEKELQVDIMNYHYQTKDFLESIATKFQVNFNNIARYLKRKHKPESPLAIIKETHSQKKISPFKAAMKNEAERCTEIDTQLAHLRSLFNNNSAKLKHLQRESESYLFVRYLDRYGLQIQEEVEEEGDTVEPLMQQESGDRNRYKYSMARTREKKWSLIQRTEYEAQRTHSLEQSRQAHTTARTSQPPLEDSPNRVTVNERLKNLLFS